MDLKVFAGAVGDRGAMPVALKTPWHRLSQALIAVSALLCLGLTLCYWLRPDALAAITIFPVGCWFLLGLLVTGLGWNRKLRRQVKWMGAMWLFFLILFADEPRSILRTLLPRSGAEGARSLRVVSFNCSVGDPLAAAEVAKWNPDVVLLQESPSRADVERLARRLFGKEGDFHWGVDGSILARGKLTPRPLPPALRSYFVQAHLQLPQGQEIEVLSLRLMTPPFRLDVWSPACWEAYRHNRRLQTAQMGAIQEQLSVVPPERAILLGGDFNAPQGDAIFGALRPRLRDSFAHAGRSWGNTIINDFPALRI
ncbi:MAG: endonuclease/exonuclease/phosphatase family protein, partial [Armatimonadetes bacterium]|nr:endonuclease/exonuclease/phosphatase family protein [Armatimonadota bacterium]